MTNLLKMIKKHGTKFGKLVLLIFIVLCVLSLIVYAYDVDPPDEPVHQHITKEALEVWKLVPYEIKNHAKHDIIDDIDTIGYQADEDIIIGSGEEDTAACIIPAGPSCPYYMHFWQPDEPRGGNYSDGLGYSYEHDSSYIRAKEIFKTKIIPLYIRGEINESYYWLGRVAHLLEDASQPSHVHLDIHPGGPDPSILEDYTANNFNSLENTYNWQGQNFAGKQYNYENLISNFDWSNIDPPSAEDKQFKELFRLFWYTAQKTQYWASDDKNGNIFYKDINGNTFNWQCSGTGSLNLWANEGYTSCANFINNSADLSAITVDREANATIPHAMKAVAGLYRLFDDAVRIDWPTPEHDYRRTSFTLLKGDMPTAAAVEKIAFVVQKNVTKEQVLKPVVADIDGNGAMETVTAVHDFKVFNPQVDLPVNRTDIYAVEVEKKKIFYGNGYEPETKKKWNITLIEPGPGGGAIYYAPTLANIDNDKQKEMIAGVRNGTIYVYDISADGKAATQRWKYKLRTKYAPIGGESIVFFTGGTAVADLDLDGKNEIIFADVDDFDEPSWPGEVYVLKDNGFGVQPTKFANYTFGNGGAYAPISIANVDADDNPEIIVPSFYGIYVLDYDASVSNKLSKKWNNAHGKIESSPVVADVDKLVKL